MINQATKLVSPVLALMLCGVLNAGAAVYDETYSSGFTASGNIPDGSTAGWSDSETISSTVGTIASITVNLNITGNMNNSDLYAYLSYNGTIVTLLNRVGVGSGNPVGYLDSGFDVTLSSSSGANNIHFYQTPSYSINGSGQLIGTYAPDGRTLNPVTTPISSPSSYDSTSGLQSLTSFDGLSANGDWTLFIADLSGGGGGTSQIVSYSLDITTVPEPVNVALAGFGGLLLLGAVFRHQWTKRRSA